MTTAKTQWAYVLFAYASLLSLGFMDNLRGPYFPQILTDLQLGDIKGAYFFAVPSLVAFLVSFMTKSWAERFGSLWCIRIGLLLMGLGYIFIGKSEGFGWLLISTTFFGFGFGLISVAQNLSIQENSSETIRRRLFSGLHGMYGFSSLMAPVVASALFSFGVIWRHAFLWMALVPWIVFLATLSRPSVPLKIKESSEKIRISLIEHRHMLVVGFIISFYLMSEVSISSRMVLFLQREYAMAPELGSLYLAGFFLLLTSCRLALAFLSLHKWSSIKIIHISLLSSIVFSLLGLFYKPWLLCLSGLTMGPVFPVALDYISQKFGTKSSMAISYCVGLCSLMVVAMHYVVGSLTEAFGIRWALLVGPVGLAIVSLGLFLQEREGSNGQ